MKAADVPRALRASLPEALAFEEGERAGRAGVAAELNPWRHAYPDYAAATVGCEQTKEHAYVAPLRTKCGKGPAFRASHSHTFTPKGVWSCRACRRAVEAERKRLEMAWHRGWISKHPK